MPIPLWAILVQGVPVTPAFIGHATFDLCMLCNPSCNALGGWDELFGAGHASQAKHYGLEGAMDGHIKGL